MQTETIDRLFLELSQVTGATTAKEFELQREVRWLREALKGIAALRTKHPKDPIATANEALQIADAVLMRHNVKSAA